MSSNPRAWFRPGPSPSPVPADADAVAPSTRRWILIVLIFATALSSIDRQILPLLLEQIKQEFALSDTQLGALTGPAFFILYALCALPLAVLSDRISRRIVIACSLALFSLATALSGLAPTLMILVICRMGVAIGEAGNVPASQAMVADIFPRRLLTTAMSWLYLSQSVGTTMGYLLGGLLGGWVGWRMTLVTVGLPGLLLVVVAWFILPKGNSDKKPDREAKQPSQAVPLRESFAFLMSQRTYLWLTAANAVWAFASAGIAMWAAVFLGRVFALPSAQIGMTMAIVMGIVGGSGLVIVGGLAQKLSKRDPRWTLWVVGLCALISTPLTLLTFLSDNGTLVWIGGCLLAIAVVSTQGSVASTVQMLVPGSMRSIAVAIKHVVVTAVGAGTAPLVVGLFNDMLADEFGAQAVRYTLASIGLLFPIAAFLFFLAARTLRAEMARAEAWKPED